ncbi:uncharacterized protein PRCAT00004597001 [Priceomyces carsonii]|uniref:uncharacterized protein n=1 Tax=Priceomyces carsonii TaxID=28549 RepID=UPI002ED7B059|nr:unnamed protein product [Priceomyces carsonii]
MDEEHYSKEIDGLRAEIHRNPFEPTKYDRLIEVLRQNGNNSDGIEVKRAKSQYFMPSPKEVSEWINDLNSIEDYVDRTTSVIAFYRQLILDYPVAEYWTRYVSFALELFKESNELISEQSLGKLITQALLEVVYDFNNGKIWSLVLSFFTSAYETSKEASDLKRLNELHLKRLSFCHKGLDDSFSEYSAFISKFDNENYDKCMIAANKIYSKTTKRQKHVEAYEIPLANSPKDAGLWIRYLENAALFSDDSRQISSIFWRSLVNGNSSTGTKNEWILVWLTYIYQLYEMEVEGQDLEEVLNKFIRCYPFSAIGYAEYIRNCETFINGEDKFVIMKSRVNEIDLMHKNSYSEWEVIALAILSFEFHQVLRQKNLDFVQYIYEDAIAYVDFAVKDNNDIFHSVEKLAVSIFEELDDIDQAQLVVQTLLKNFKDQCEVWLYAYEFEKRHGFSYQDISALLNEAASFAASLDWPERIIQEWLLYEQVYGDFFVYRESLTRANKILKELRSEDRKNQRIKRKLEDEAVDKEELRNAKSRKRTNSEEEPKRSRESFSIKVSGLPSDYNLESVAKFFEDCGTIRSIEKFEEKDGSSNALLEFSSEPEVFAALTKDKKRIEGNEIAVKRLLGCTLWINNFPPSWTKLQIRDLIDIMKVPFDVRFPSQVGKKARRFCYVEFTKHEDALKARDLFKNKELHDDVSKRLYNLTAEISSPPTAKKSQNISNKEIYVSNLDFKTVDENTLQNFFQSCGEIVKITLPVSTKKHSSGMKNGGFGFIRFADESDVEKALELNNKTLEKRQINIQRISNSQKDPSYFSDDRSISLLNLQSSTSAQQLQSYLVKNVGPVSGIEMYPKISLALVEFQKVSDSGRASLLLSSAKFDSYMLEVGLKADLIEKLNPNQKQTSSKNKRMIPPMLQRRR